MVKNKEYIEIIEKTYYNSKYKTINYVYSLLPTDKYFDDKELESNHKIIVDFVNNDLELSNNSFNNINITNTKTFNSIIYLKTKSIKTYLTL